MSLQALAWERARTIRWARLPFYVLVYALLVFLAAAMVLPYVWMIANSVKTVPAFYANPYSLVPSEFTLTTYQNVLGFGRMGIYIKNSLIYTLTVLCVQLTIDSMAAYAFARIEFPGRNKLFILLLATVMLPGTVTLIPRFLIVYYLGMANAYSGVVVPAFASAFGIFMLRQFFLNIPRDLDDAARIDGAGSFGIYHRIVLPIAKPALIALSIFIFLDEWNAFLWPLIVLSDWQKYPITVGIALFRDMNRVDWPMVFAAASAVSFPVVVLFFVSQKYVIGGISLSGLKG
jgi:multiple sugar transport system permease protein